MKLLYQSEKNILGVFQKLPAKQHSQSSPFPPKLGWIGCAIQQANPKWLPGFFFLFNIKIFIYFFKYEIIETHAHTFLTLNILAISRVGTLAGDLGGINIWTPWSNGNMRFRGSVLVHKPSFLIRMIVPVDLHLECARFLYQFLLTNGSLTQFELRT